VLDPFFGTGTTIEAAIGLGHDAIWIELEEKYFEAVKQRLQKLPCKISIDQDACNQRTITH